MWVLILIMAYISLIIGHRGFGGKDDLWESICRESLGGVTFDLGPLLKGQMWPLIPIMAHISLTITLGGFGCEDNSSYRKSCAPNLLVMSDLTLDPGAPILVVGSDLSSDPSL